MATALEQYVQLLTSLDVPHTVVTNTTTGYTTISLTEYHWEWSDKVKADAPHLIQTIVPGTAAVEGYTGFECFWTFHADGSLNRIGIFE